MRLQLDQRVVMNHYRAGELLRLPGLGPCKLRWSRRPAGIPKMVTLRLNAAGRYWASLAVEETIPAPPATASEVCSHTTYHDTWLLDGRSAPRGLLREIPARRFNGNSRVAELFRDLIGPIFREDCRSPASAPTRGYWPTIGAGTRGVPPYSSAALVKAGLRRALQDPKWGTEPISGFLAQTANDLLYRLVVA